MFCVRKDCDERKGKMETTTVSFILEQNRALSQSAFFSFYGRQNVIPTIYFSSAVLYIAVCSAYNSVDQQREESEKRKRYGSLLMGRNNKSTQCDRIMLRPDYVPTLPFQILTFHTSKEQQLSIAHFSIPYRDLNQRKKYGCRFAHIL